MKAAGVTKPLAAAVGKIFWSTANRAPSLGMVPLTKKLEIAFAIPRDACEMVVCPLPPRYTRVDELGSRLRSAFADLRGVVGSFSAETMRIGVLAVARRVSVFDIKLTPTFGTSGRVEGKLRQNVMGISPAFSIGVSSEIEMLLVREMTVSKVTPFEAALSTQPSG